MANKKINQLVSKTAILSTDLFGIGDATTGQLFKKTIAELQAAIGGAVISVNGLVGTVVLDTDDIQELATPTNKYFTDARARAAISLTVTGNSGASTYSSGTGVLNVPTYTLAGLGGITASFLSGTSGISYNSTTGVITYSGTVYTDASIRALFSGSTGITYNSSTGAISYSGTVYTDSSVRALISMTTTGDSGASTYNNTTGVINVPNYTLAGLGGITLGSLSGGTGITYNNTTGAISYSGTVYTDASVRALISATGNISYNSTTGVISTSLTQYTDALARASVSLTTTGTSGASTYNSTTGVFNIPNYGSALSGYLPLTGGTLTGALGGTSASFSSSVTNAGLIFNTNDAVFSTAGSITKHSVVGLALKAVTASVFDFSVYSASGTALITNATGTNNIGFSGGQVTFTGGNVGIGTSSPNFNNYGTALSLLSASGYGGIEVYGSGSTNGGQIDFGSGSTRFASISGEYESSTNGYLNIRTLKAGTMTNAVRITSAGEVAIGTTTPLLTAASRGNLTINGATSNIITLGIAGSYSGYLFSDSTKVELSTSAQPMTFVTNGAERMRITASSNILLGTTSDNGERLYVSGAIRATSTITANSDLTLKKNLLKIENALEKVEQINGYTYEFKEDDSKRHAGVIAQEIQTVLPEIVNKGNDGILGVEYGNISALLIEAIKEQNIKIKNLETLLASK